MQLRQQNAHYILGGAVLKASLEVRLRRLVCLDLHQLFGCHNSEWTGIGRWRPRRRISAEPLPSITVYIRNMILSPFVTRGLWKQRLSEQVQGSATPCFRGTHLVNLNRSCTGLVPGGQDRLHASHVHAELCNQQLPDQVFPDGGKSVTAH